jgi:hypothetical protein
MTDSDGEMIGASAAPILFRPLRARKQLQGSSTSTAGRYEIAVDGKPRSYRSDEATAREGAIFLKTKNPNAEVRVRDIVTGETTAVKHPLTK